MRGDEIVCEDNGKVLVVRLPMSIDAHIKIKFEEIMPQWLEQKHKVLIIDMQNVLSLSNQMYPFFVQLAKALKEKEKIFYSVGVNKKLQMQLSSDGLAKVFNYANSFDEVYQKQGISPAKKVSLDSNIINPFIEATFQTLKIQANMNSIDAGKPYIKKAGVPDANIGIAAVISMVCSDFNGTISLEFPKIVFLKIYESMLGESHTEITDEIKDCAAEILNMIYGQAKTALNSKGYNLEKAIPTVMAGDKLRIHHTSGAAALVVPIHTPHGDFYMEVALGQN